MKHLSKIIVCCFAAAAFNCAIVASSTAEAISYEYDTLGRLVVVTYADGRSVTYDFDPLGNRKALTTSVANPNKGFSENIDTGILSANSVKRDPDDKDFGDFWEFVIRKEGIERVGGMFGLHSVVFSDKFNVAKEPMHINLQTGRPD